MRKILTSNWTTIIILLIISIFSLFTILSIKPESFKMQLIYIILGFAIYYIVSRINPSYYQAFAKEFYILSVILLFVTFAIGIVIKGSVRWVDFGFVQFQPSEIIKPFLIIFFADRFCHQKNTFKSFIFDIFLFALLAGLVFKQPDFGNFIVYSAIFFLMLAFSKAKIGHLLILLGFVLVFLPLIFSFLKPYQKARLTSFINPQSDPQGNAYHQIQSVITVGSGQFLGQGIGRGTQTHLLFLPEKQTDFIFASYSEEFGFVGDIILLTCYFLLFYKLLYLISVSKTDFNKFFLIGVFGYLFSQSMIHIGMNIGVLPVTGVTLPLFSYGGSSITSVLITLGLVAFYEKDSV